MPNTNIKRKRRALGAKTCGGPTKFGIPGFTSSRVEFKMDFGIAKSKEKGYVPNKEPLARNPNSTGGPCGVIEK